MKQQNFLLTVITFLFLSFLVFFLSARQLLFGQGLLGNALFGIEGLVYAAFHSSFSAHTSEIDTLRQENSELHAQVANLLSVQADDKALRDQFQTTEISTGQLVPAKIIGAPSFFPGVSLPDEIVIGLGRDDGVSVGQTVVYKNGYIGSVLQVASHAGLVRLVTHPASLLTAEDLVTGALGIVKGQGQEEMVLDNVALSDQLKVGDTVVTSPGKNLEGKGYPPGLVLGTISSIEKNPSSLFQKAHIKLMYHIEKLPIVFILK